MLFKVSSVWRWKWTASSPFSLHLTEHIHAVRIWVEFKISQRGCRVNMSAIGKAALPDWRNFCPANKQYSKLAAQNLTSVQTSSGYCLNPSEKWVMEQVLLVPVTPLFSHSLAGQVATARVSLQPWWPSYQIEEVYKAKEMKWTVPFKWFHMWHSFDSSIPTGGLLLFSFAEVE